MKNFEQQYSRYKSKRPQADIFIDQSEALLSISFSWGEINANKLIKEALVNNFFAVREDLEVTSAYESLQTMTPLANRIRAALLVASGAVYSNFNTKTFAAGSELLCIAKENREVVIAQVGGPSVILVRKNENILLTSSVDHYFDKLEPLPSKLIGPTVDCYPQIISFRLDIGDQLFFIARSYFPKSLLSLKLNSTLVSLTQLLSQDDPRTSFWLGRITL